MVVAAEPGYQMRKPCAVCGCPTGRIETKGQQDCVFCSECGKFQYNAPRTETGKETRAVTTIHNGISPKQRARILTRDGFACIICHNHNAPIQVGHLLSVKAAFSLHEAGMLAKPLTDEQINSDENLAAMCEECNSGLGASTVPLYLLMGIFLARLKLQRKAGK